MKKILSYSAFIIFVGGLLILGILGWFYDYGCSNPIYLTLKSYNNLSIVGFVCLVLGFILFLIWLFYDQFEEESSFPPAGPWVHPPWVV